MLYHRILLASTYLQMRYPIAFVPTSSLQPRSTLDRSLYQCLYGLCLYLLVHVRLIEHNWRANVRKSSVAVLDFMACLCLDMFDSRRSAYAGANDVRVGVEWWHVCCPVQEHRRCRWCNKLCYLLLRLRRLCMLKGQRKCCQASQKVKLCIRGQTLWL
jgi:hypothetical protein